MWTSPSSGNYRAIHQVAAAGLKSNLDLNSNSNFTLFPNLISISKVLLCDVDVTNKQEPRRFIKAQQLV